MHFGGDFSTAGRQYEEANPPRQSPHIRSSRAKTRIGLASPARCEKPPLRRSTTHGDMNGTKVDQHQIFDRW
jgi:hypothetical protein